MTGRRIVLVGVLLAAACSKPNADEHLAKGNEYFAANQIAEAVVEFKAAVAADPMRGDARFRLAEAAEKAGDLPGAYREFVRAADLLPGDIKAQIQAGRYLLLARQFEDAEARARKALEIDASSTDALILLGNALAGLKDLDGALAEFQEALALNPGEDEAAVSIGAVHFAKGDRAAAEASFQQAVQASPNSVQARLALASFLWASGRQNEAEGSLKAALAIDPANLGANRALGVFYMSTNRTAEAEPFFQTIAKTADTTEAFIGLADYYVAVRRLDEARTVLRDLASRDKGAFGPATVRLASIEAADNNRPVAHKLVDEVLVAEPRFAAGRLLKVRLDLADARHDEALTGARALAADDPNSPAAAEAWLVVGAIEAMRDRTDESIKAYEEALRIRPQSVPASLAMGGLFLRLGNLPRAETHLMQVLALQPNNPSARALQVRLDLARGQTAKADAGLAALQKEYPNAAPVLNLTGAGHLAAGRLDAARAAYTRAAEASAPGDLEALQGLVTIDFRQNRPKDAVARVESAMKRLPASTALYVLAARTYLGVRDVPAAEGLLRKAIELDPSRLAAYGLLGQIYVSEKRLPDARDQFQTLIEKNPRSLAANTMLAMIMEAQGDKAAAEAQYEKTLGVNPEAAVAANNLAWLWVASDRNLEQALQLAQTAIRHLPNSPQVQDTLGWIYVKKGQPTMAISHLEASVKGEPNDPAAYYHLGMAYVGTGEVAKARQALEKALGMNPTFDGAADARKALSDLGK